jgi:hypothetical protein
MGDDLFLDLWQSQHSTSRTGPLIPSTHQIQDPRKKYFVKKEISRLWQLPGVKAYNPSPNPVSIDRQQLPCLKTQAYVAAEKTDGIRYLLLLSQYPGSLGGQPCGILVNRKYDMYEIRIMAEEKYFQGSLFDGELVWEYENGQYAPPRQVLMLFDMMACQGTCYVHENYLKRFETIADIFELSGKDITQDPRKWTDTAQELAEHHKVVCEGNQYCLTFRPKRVLPIQQLDILWRSRATLKHKSDGLIFTPVEEPVRTGTHSRMFKWKSHHTVDLVWQVQWNDKQNHWDYRVRYRHADKDCFGDRDGVTVMQPLELHQQIRQVPLIIVPNTYAKTILDWHFHRGEYKFAHVVECSCRMPNMAEWLSETEVPMIECSILKIRHDKMEPNQKTTIEHTLRNIQENITIKELLDVIQSHQQNLA